MFKCSKCGACCRSIAGIELFRDMDDGSGTCKFLDKDSNLCKIYNSRPLFCNVDEMYNKFYKNSMSRQDFYNLNYSACEKLIKINLFKLNENSL